jgi:hypothetical protein
MFKYYNNPGQTFDQNLSSFSAHIAHSFLVETEGSRAERAKHTLTHMGPGKALKQL